MKLRKLGKPTLIAALAAFFVHASVYSVYTYQNSLFDRANPFTLVIAGFFLMGLISSFLFLKEGGVMDKKNWSAPLIGALMVYFPLLAVSLALVVPSPEAPGYFMAALICFPFSLFGVAVAIMLYVGNRPIGPYKTLLLRPFVSVALVGALVYAGLLFFMSINYASPNLVTAGWAAIRPQPSTISYYSNGRFYASFINLETETITVNDLRLDETQSAETKCKLIPLRGVFIKPEESFYIGAYCPEKKAGKQYDLQIRITYSTQEDVFTDITERGHIMGQVVAA